MTSSIGSTAGRNVNNGGYVDDNEEEEEKDYNFSDDNDHQKKDSYSHSNSNSEDDFDEEASDEQSAYDTHETDERGQVSSDSSPDTLSKRHYEDSVRLHSEAAMRENNRELQRKLYNDNKGYPKSVDVANAIKRVMKEKVYPRLKILSDTESQFLTPDFVGRAIDQSRTICEILVRELDLPATVEEKVRFWITYRSLVKNQLVKYRSNCVEELKREYFRGKET
jgi:hypothetical protein